MHLATVLDIPLRDGNSLLHAAGFAPAYTDFNLDAPEMDGVRAVLATILDAHMPNPALVVDRLGNLVDANGGALALMGAVVAPDSPALAPVPNINRLALHPEGIRSRTNNWQQLASSLLIRLERERDHRPADAALEDLVNEMAGYAEAAGVTTNDNRNLTGADLVVPMNLSLHGGETLSLISTISTLGSPYDVTLDELRLETFFPTDESSRRILANW